MYKQRYGELDEAGWEVSFFHIYKEIFFYKMEYAKHKKELLEFLLVEADISFSDLLPVENVVLSKEENESEDEINKLIAEVIKKYTLYLKQKVDMQS